MLHAGVLMKLGGYGCFRVAIYLMPEAAKELSWIFIILTGISVVYGAYSAIVQTDLKYINAYSIRQPLRARTLCHPHAQPDGHDGSRHAKCSPTD